MEDSPRMRLIVAVNCSSSCRRAEVASSSFFFQTKKSFAPRVTRTARLFPILNEGGARRRKREFASAPRSAAQFPATTAIAFSYNGKRVIRNPEAARHSRTEICAGVNSTIAAFAKSCATVRLRRGRRTPGSFVRVKREFRGAWRSILREKHGSCETARAGGRSHSPAEN